MSIKAAKPEHVESVEYSKPLSRGQRFGRHCKKRWWVWLLAFVACTTIFMLVLAFGIIPPLAQKTIDATTLTVDSLTILDPRPDQFQISVVSHITGSSSLAHNAEIDGFDVDFHLPDSKPFLTMPLPGVHGSDSILVEKLNYTAKLENEKEFMEFAGLLMSADTFDLGVKGDTKVHLGAFNAAIKYRETVKMKGFNHLSGMVIVKYDLQIGSKDGYNLAGKVVIPNPTVVTLQLGDVGIAFDLDGEPLGTGVIPNLIISPGLKKVYDFKAKLSTKSLLRLGGAVAKGHPVMQVSSTGSKVDGVDIPWLTGPLSSLKADVPIDTKFDLTE